MTGFPPIGSRLGTKPSFAAQGSERSGERGAIDLENRGELFLRYLRREMQGLQESELGKLQARGTKRVVVVARGHSGRPAETGARAGERDRPLSRFCGMPALPHELIVPTSIASDRRGFHETDYM